MALYKSMNLETMKNYSASQHSLFISLIFSFLVAGVLVLGQYVEKQQIMLLISIPLVFIFVFFYTNYIFTHFISVKNNREILSRKDTQGSRDSNSPDVATSNARPTAEEGEAWTKRQIKEIERLKDLEKYRKEFVGNVSHELKTPIFNIQGYILTLLEGAIDDSKINKLYLQRTEKSIDRMISIVEDLESITRLESGELKLKYEVFDIVKMVEDVFELEQMLANEHKITMGFGNKPFKPIFVHADKKKITEVITNLIVNSIKYGKKKGFVKVLFFDNGNKIFVEVRDNGIGIDKKNLHRIFERFYRVDKSRSREQGGTGLGLSIVKHIIEAHKQTIEVKSLIDKGTSFTFTLEKAPELK
ncbi:Phosphate regulon sensor protein PhoR (SphS) [hydrothermal vent metagenome]|uniref:histidine kinase n=1 Tax=hydrothermal vent metagenome TaxID=652676 RepID=A0A3B0UVS2_9ZZZZ